jgi:hypothetical protein
MASALRCFSSHQSNRTTSPVTRIALGVERAKEAADGEIVVAVIFVKE